MGDERRHSRRWRTLGRGASARWIAASCAVFCGAFVGGSSPVPTVRSSAAPTSCQSLGASRSTFPASSGWRVVNQQTFNGPTLPADWYAFRGYYDGGITQSHHSLREPSMLTFPGSWMRYRNRIVSNGANGSYHTVADAGASEEYHESYDPATHTTDEGYDVASHPWGFQWCARFFGGRGFDTAFAFVPTDGAWPPEIDFIEHAPKAGNQVELNIHWTGTTYDDGNHCDAHYPTSNTQNCRANMLPTSVIVGRWTSYAVTWSASEIDVWIDGVRIASSTVTARTCTQRADQKDNFGDTGVEHGCLPNGYAGNVSGGSLEPFVWDMQVNSLDGTTSYGRDLTDLAWFKALRP